MAVIKRTQVINKPVDVVFQTVVDVANFPNWNPTTPSARKLSNGLNIAKRVFQAHAVDPESGEVRRTRLQRGEVLRHLAQMHPAFVVMEACSSAQHWAREIRKLGHEVRLISPPFVRPFVKTNKIEAADAQAIWMAAQQPEMRSVAVKTEEQQAVLALHDIRTVCRRAAPPRSTSYTV